MEVEMAITQRHAVVTGASGGLGRALCRELLAAGLAVSAIDIDSDALDSLAAQSGSDRLRCLRLDITDAAAIESAFEDLRSRSGPVDLLINNAGITHFSKVAEISPETVAQVMAVDFTGAALCTRAALPDLIGERGQVVAISSVAGFAPLFGRAVYSASKHALEGFFETLRCEVREAGVGVLVVRPSFIGTQGDRVHAQSPYAGASRPGSARATVGEVLCPEDVARQILGAIDSRRRHLLVGRVAKQSYWLRRLWPGLYERIMVKQAREEIEGAGS
jgi:NAD(P)-dependent dehydrogenase (short-subunit alcohol dehydrogenase family)